MDALLEGRHGHLNDAKENLPAFNYAALREVKKYVN